MDTNWKSRATPVSSNSDWKSRAESISTDNNTSDEGEPKLFEAITRKPLQGLTFGIADEVGAGMQAGMDVGLNYLPKSIVESDITKKLLDGTPQQSGKKLSDLHQLYQEYKQLQNEKENQISEKYPIASVVGEMAGSLPLAFTPAGAANTLGKAAALGGLYGLGKSEADLTSGDPSQLLQGAQDTATGGVLSGIGYKVAPLIGKAFNATGIPGMFKKAGQSLQNEAESDALKVFGPGVKDIKKELGNSLFSPEEYTKGIGKEAYNKMKMSGGPRAVRLNVAEEVKTLSGQKQELLNNVNEQLQQKMSVDPSVQTLVGVEENSLSNTLNNYKNKLLTKIKRTDPMGSLISKKKLEDGTVVETIGNLDNYIEEIAKNDKDLLKLDQLRSDIGEKLGNSAFVRDPNSPEALNEQILREVYFTLQSRIENLASTVHPDLGSQVKNINMKQSNLLDLGRIAFNAESKLGTNASGGNTGNFMALTAGGGLAHTLGVTGQLPLLGAALTGLAAKKGIEKMTGFETTQLGRMGFAKTEMGAGKMGSGIGNALTNPNTIQAGLRPVAKDLVSYGANNLVGTAQASTETMKPLEMSQKAYTATAEELSGAAQKLMTNPQFQTYGKALQDALSNQDPEKKNAVIFTILQNPKMRSFLNGQ